MDSKITRRRLLRSATVAGGIGLAGCSQLRPPSADDRTTAPGTDDRSTAATSSGGPDASPPPEDFPESVALETVASGLQAPVSVSFPEGEDRSYVADQTGVVYVYESGTRRDRPFLDLRDVVDYGGEKGLLGVALHPKFGENGRLFVRYSAPRRSGTPSNYSHTFVLSEFRATADGLRAVADSERTVLEIA
ncbi:PQQ-dependent sugar dehydrogenase, partial [Halobium palmae]